MKVYLDQRVSVDKHRLELFNYLTEICGNFRAMYNTVNFHIRQHLTGLQKDIHSRQPNEQVSIEYVRQGLHQMNEHYRQQGKNKHFPDPSANQWFPGYYALEAVFKMQEDEDYRRLPAQLSQNAIRQCVADWQAFFQSLETYRSFPERFTGRPGIPRYKKETLMTAVFTNQACLLKTNTKGQVSLKFPGTKIRMELGRFPMARTGVLKEVKAVPVHGIFELHILMEVDMERPEYLPEPDRCIAIDLGVENFAAIADNIGLPPILVRGNVMKSRNWWFNHQIALAESKEMQHLKDSRKYALTRRIHRLELRRERFFRDYFHKITKRLMDHCKENRIDTIVVGKNVGWKQNVSLGKRNNRNFVRIPYTMFVKQLSYKAERNGVRLIFQEESYTSRASFLDGDPLPGYPVRSVGTEDKKDNVAADENVIRLNPQEGYRFSGKRVHRGLYVSASGVSIHSDVNGACNILRKAVPKAFDAVPGFRYLKNPVSWRYADWYMPEQSTKKTLKMQYAA